jgi:hypothetical protein
VDFYPIQFVYLMHALGFYHQHGGLRFSVRWF